jgi:hypothetical protein
VASDWPRAQAKAWDCATGQHGARRLHFLYGVRPGWAGATTILLLSHAGRVLQALVVAPFSQLHQACGHLRPLTRDIHGGVAISVVVPVLLRNEGYEPAPAAHRRLLLPAPDTGPLQVHRACLPRQVGALERRLSTGAGGCPRPAHALCCHAEWVKDPILESGFDPRAGSNPIPGQEWLDLADGAARLPVEAPHTPPGSTPPHVDVHQGERHHTAVPWAWVEPGQGLAGREHEGADRRPSV